MERRERGKKKERLRKLDAVQTLMFRKTPVWCLLGLPHAIVLVIGNQKRKEKREVIGPLGHHLHFFRAWYFDFEYFDITAWSQEG